MIITSNTIDLLIVIILIYFAYQGLRAGFWFSLANLLSFIGSLVLALRFYPQVSGIIQSKFVLTSSISNALSFLLTATLSEFILGFILLRSVIHLPRFLWKRALVKPLGVFPGIGEGLLIVSFLVTLILSFPVAPNIKSSISNSKIGKPLISETIVIESKFKEIFGSVIKDTLTYLTVHPDSRESVPLEVATGILHPDPSNEQAMFDLINAERRARGIAELAWRQELVPIARGHAEDMWERKYFSHYSPEGKTVGDRLTQGNISYTFAGENLAKAPTLETAHAGLMNSQGHRENILEPRFRRLGIGIITNGVYGMLFVQIFTD